MNAGMVGIEACVFDAYGTVFDVHSAVARLRAQVGERADALSQLWRSKQLEYTWLRALMGRHADFWQVTGDALDYALARAGVDPAVREPLMQAYLELDAYREVPDVLRRLRHGGLRTVVLSNGEPRMLAAAATRAGIGELLDAILSVEEVGIFKPHPTVYQLALDRLGVPPHQVAFQSSNGWDVCGGLRPPHGMDQSPGHATGAPAWRCRARASRSVRTACPARAVKVADDRARRGESGRTSQ